MLDLARSVGTLSLVLRNQTDPKSVVAGGGATKAALLGLPAPEPVKVAASAPAPAVRRPAPALAAAAMPVMSRNCVEVIRGLSKVTECF
jgi:pilus assembly protein CpaB